MLAVYVPNGHSLERRVVVSGEEVPDNAIWFDLVNPAAGEDKLIENRLGIAVPTREEMQEIEVSSRLYTEHHARFMTATLMCNSDTVVPKTTAVTFILAKHCLVTVRYDEPRPFMLVGNKLTRTCPQTATGETVLMELLDAVIDREADLLERIGMDVDEVSHDIFDPRGKGPEQGAAYIDTLKVIGTKGDLTRRCARAWFRSDGCFCSLPTRPRACAGARTCGCSCRRCSATCCRSPTTPLILPTRSPSCSTRCWAW
jgi:magnesium transporter